MRVAIHVARIHPKEKLNTNLFGIERIHKSQQHSNNIVSLPRTHQSQTIRAKNKFQTETPVSH